MPDQAPYPDTLFWYTFAAALATILGTILIIVITRYVNKTDDNFKVLTGIIDFLKDSNSDLKSMLKIHEHRLDGHDDDIEQIKGNYIVRHKKKPD